MSRRPATRRVSGQTLTEATPRDRYRNAPAGQPTRSEHVSQPISVDDASRTYEGEWVLMKVTGWDEKYHIAEGEVLCHSPSRKQISRYLQQAREQDPSMHVYIFPGGTRRVPGHQLREIIANAAGAEYINARW